MAGDRPRYDLQWIQYRVQAGDYQITRMAADGARLLGFDEHDIVACVCGLTPSDFHKSMESTEMPGLWQDVYRPHYEGVAIYLKLQMGRSGAAVVIQFKEK